MGFGATPTAAPPTNHSAMLQGTLRNWVPPLQCRLADSCNRPSRSGSAVPRPSVELAEHFHISATLSRGHRHRRTAGPKELCLFPHWYRTLSSVHVLPISLLSSLSSLTPAVWSPRCGHSRQVSWRVSDLLWIEPLYPGTPSWRAAQEETFTVRSEAPPSRWKLGESRHLWASVILQAWLGLLSPVSRSLFPQHRRMWGVR